MAGRAPNTFDAARRGAGDPSQLMPITRGVSNGVSLLTNPGGLSGLPGAIYQHRTTSPGSPIPLSIAGPARDLWQRLRDVPARPNADIKRSHSRLAAPLVYQGNLYPVPHRNELCFIYMPPTADAVRRNLGVVSASPGFGPGRQTLSPGEQRDLRELERAAYMAGSIERAHSISAALSVMSSYTAELVHCLGLQAMNHFLACQEARRFADMLGSVAGARADAAQTTYARFIADMFSRESVPELANRFSFEGVVKHAVARTPRGHPSLDANVSYALSLTSAGPAEIHNYPLGKNTKEHAFVWLVFRRVRIDLREARSAKAAYQMTALRDSSGETDGLEARPALPILPNPYSETDPRTRYIYALQGVVAAYDEAGVPDFSRGLEQYTSYPATWPAAPDAPAGESVQHTDGLVKRLARVRHRGGQPSNGALLGRGTGYTDDAYDPTLHDPALTRDLFQAAQCYPPVLIDLQPSWQ
jgi:hypothetical protein